MSQASQSYATQFSCFLHSLAGTVLRGYALTKSQDGTGFVVATTAALAVSASGLYAGVALEDGAAFGNIALQRDAYVFPENCPWLGPGAIENAVVDANGKVQRASVASGPVIGTVDREGGVAINLAGSGAVGSLALSGDVTGPSTSNTVIAIRGRSVSATAPITGQALAWNGTTWIPTTVTTAPAGSDTQIQYNNAGAFGGAANVTYAGGNLNVATAITFGATPAASGLLRAPNASTIVAARNAAATADLAVLATDASNNVTLGGSSGLNNVQIQFPAGNALHFFDGAVDLGSITNFANSIQINSGAGLILSLFGVSFLARFSSGSDWRSANGFNVTNNGSTGNGLLSIGANPPAWNSLDTGLFLNNNTTNPTAGPTNGCYLFVNAGVLRLWPSGAAMAFGQTPATAGTWRVPTSWTLNGRNAANSANLELLNLNASDQLIVGAGPTTTILSSPATYLANGVVFIQGTTAPANTGTFRLSNAFTCNVRNAANTADAALLAFDSGNNVLLGGSTAVTAVKVTWTAGGSLQLLDGATTIGSFTNFANGLAINAGTGGYVQVVATTMLCSVSGAGDFRFGSGISLTNNGSTGSGLLAIGANGPAWNSLNAGMFLENITTAPTAAPTAGTYVYANAGLRVQWPAGGSLHLLDGTTDIGNFANFANGLQINAGSGGYVEIVATTMLFSVSGVGDFRFGSGVSITNNGSNGTGLLAIGANNPAYNSLNAGIFLENITTAPTANPSGGGYLYSDAGALKWRSPNGVITTMAAA